MIFMDLYIDVKDKVIVCTSSARIIIADNIRI